MTGKKKALASSILCIICALIWIVLCIASYTRLSGTTQLILMISAAIAFAVGAIGWSIRYLRLK